MTNASTAHSVLTDKACAMLTALQQAHAVLPTLSAIAQAIQTQQTEEMLQALRAAEPLLSGDLQKQVRDAAETYSNCARHQAYAQVRSISAMVAALSVDWDRLQELRDKAKAGHYVAGCNMPGYMPDSEPCAVDTCDEARDYLADEMDRDADQGADSREATGDRLHSDYATALSEAAQILRAKVGDPDADYGQTIGRYHYWLTHEPGKLADPDEEQELSELEEAAGDCTDEEDARTRIEEDPLSVEVRSGWHSVGETLEPAEFRIVLCTGGPHVELQGELGADNEPDRVRVLYSDWGDSGEIFDFDRDAVLTYCRQFHFGE